MLVGEIIERIESLYSKGVSSDDSRLSSRHVYSKMLTVRARIVSQQLKSKRKLSDWAYSILPCVELIRVPRNECTCLEIVGCDVWRTKEKLPRTFADNSKHIIEYVMSIDSSMRIEEISPSGVLYLKGNKYTANKPRYVIENGYLYFPVKDNPGIVRIKLVCEDPIEAEKFPSYCGEKCADSEECVECKAVTDFEFNIDADLLESLISLTIIELERGFYQRAEDSSNNSDDDIVSRQSQQRQQRQQEE